MSVEINSTVELTPPERLALAHCRADLRQPMQWLLEFDRRLSQAVLAKAEPIMAQMRLAWWREQLARPAPERAKGEPMLQSLAGLDVMTPSLAELALQLVDQWETKAVDVIDGSSSPMPTPAVFSGYCDWLGASESDRRHAVRLAQIWLGESDDWPSSRIPRQLRPLSILALSVLIDRQREKAATASRIVLPFRLLWHSLSGS